MVVVPKRGMQLRADLAGNHHIGLAALWIVRTASLNARASSILRPSTSVLFGPRAS